MKFGAKVGYEKLYCITKNQLHVPISPFICPFFFLSNKKTVTDFSASSGAGVFELCELCIHCEDDQVYCVKENKVANVYFAFFFRISFFFISTPL